jgi:hypothetical protein
MILLVDGNHYINARSQTGVDCVHLTYYPAQSINLDAVFQHYLTVVQWGAKMIKCLTLLE